MMISTTDPCSFNQTTEWGDDDTSTFHPTPQVYHSSKTVNWFHNHGFRFGSSADLLSYIKNNSNDSNDNDEDGYVIGLWATTILTGMLLLLWGLLIIYFSCLRHRLRRPSSKKSNNNNKGDVIVFPLDEEEDQRGHENVREPTTTWMMGKPFIKPLPPRAPIAIWPGINRTTATLMLDKKSSTTLLLDHQSDIVAVPQSKRETTSLREEEDEPVRMKDYNNINRDYQKYQQHYYQWKYEKGIYKKRIIFARMTVILGCLIVLITSTLFFAMGAEQITTLRQSSRDDLEQIQVKVHQGIELTDDFLKVVEASSSAVILDQVNTFCPLIRPTICETIGTLNGCNWNDIPHGTSLQNWIRSLNHMETDLARQLESFQSDLYAGIQQIDEWIDILDRLQKTLNWSKGFVVFLNVLCVYVLAGAIMAWCKIRAMSNKIWAQPSSLVVPIFVVAIVASWLFAMVFVMGSMATSDFCFDGPDEKIIALVEKNQSSLSPVLLSLIRQVTTRCSNSFVTDIFLDEIDQLQESVKAARVLQLEPDLCGPSALDTLTEASTMAQQELCSGAASLQDTRVAFACSHWSSMYTDLTYDSLCNETMDGLAWASISQCAIVVVAMVILTFRVVMLPVKYVRWNPKVETASKHGTGTLKQPSTTEVMAFRDDIEANEMEALYVATYSDCGDSTTEEEMACDLSNGSAAEPNGESKAENLASHKQPRIVHAKHRQSSDNASIDLVSESVKSQTPSTIEVGEAKTKGSLPIDCDSGKHILPIRSSWINSDSVRQSSISTIRASNATKTASPVAAKHQTSRTPAHDDRSHDNISVPSLEDTSVEEATYSSDNEYDEEKLPRGGQRGSGQNQKQWKSPVEHSLETSSSETTNPTKTPSFGSNLDEFSTPDSAEDERSLIALPKRKTVFSEEKQTKQSNKDYLTLRVSDGQFQKHSVSSLGQSAEDLTLKSDTKSVQSREECSVQTPKESMTAEAAPQKKDERDPVAESKCTVAKSVEKGTMEPRFSQEAVAVDDSDVPDTVDPKTLAKESWHSNLPSIDENVPQKKGDDDSQSFHFSLNLDLATFHSTDFGDFSDGLLASQEPARDDSESKTEKPLAALSVPTPQRFDSLSSFPSFADPPDYEVASTSTQQHSMTESNAYATVETALLAQTEGEKIDSSSILPSIADRSDAYKDPSASAEQGEFVAYPTVETALLGATEVGKLDTSSRSPSITDRSQDYEVASASTQQGESVAYPTVETALLGVASE
eukprot:scaffold10382_cov103-Cylindrotheca_fusiformis.AAC.1